MLVAEDIHISYHACENSKSRFKLFDAFSLFEKKTRQDVHTFLSKSKRTEKYIDLLFYPISYEGFSVKIRHNHFFFNFCFIMLKQCI